MATNPMDLLRDRVKVAFGKLAGADPPPTPVVGDPTKPATQEEKEYWKKQEAVVQNLMSAFRDPAVAEPAKDDTELFTIKSEDGTYDIECRFYRAKPAADGSLPPLVIHFHGGGMTILTRDDPPDVCVCASLRNYNGCAVLSPEFRNAREFHFPAGVDDCVSTLKWAHENKEALGVGSVVVLSGMSGGGNLSLATYLRAMEKGLPVREMVSGIYSQAPFIRANYTGNEKLDAVFSPFTTCDAMDNLRKNYTASEEDAKNPSAWPLLATDEMLKQFPPTLLVGEEFDIFHVDAEELYERLASLDVEGVQYIFHKRRVHCETMLYGTVSPLDSFLGYSQIGSFAQSIKTFRDRASNDKQFKQETQ